MFWWLQHAAHFLAPSLSTSLMTWVSFIIHQQGATEYKKKEIWTEDFICLHDASAVLHLLSLTAPGYPVRRKYPNADSKRLTIVEPMLPCDDDEENSFSEQQEEATRTSKRLLPDRSHAAYNRANEKLVHFIVKQRMVDQRLLVRTFWVNWHMYGRECRCAEYQHWCNSVVGTRL